MGVVYGPRTAFVGGIKDLFLQLRVSIGSEQRLTSTGELPAIIRVSLLILLICLHIDCTPGNLKDSSDERKGDHICETTPENATCQDALFQAAATALEMLVSL
jgi:hypothetical protein